MRHGNHNIGSQTKPIHSNAYQSLNQLYDNFTKHKPALIKCTVGIVLLTLIGIRFGVLDKGRELGEYIHPCSVGFWMSSTEFGVSEYTETGKLTSDGVLTDVWLGTKRLKHVLFNSLWRTEDVLKELFDLVDICLDLSIKGYEGGVGSWG